MNIKPIDQVEGDELAWLAELYVLGELNEASSNAMEDRLLLDQAAREALASAVARLTVVKIAGPPIANTVPAKRATAKPWNLRTAWLATIAAAILVGAFWVSQSEWTDLESKRELANAWSETRELSADSFAVHELLALDAASIPSDDIEAPDWLITAVSLKADAEAPSQEPVEKASSGEGA